ncbi:MAG TPA: MOSC domain-containing protein [Candidatus Paceibacterota bacterium]|nr:MOSC domain-containing protein [Candidatus Paceibacterota bacterium]
MRGIVSAVCISANGGIPKYPQQVVTVDKFGLVGDYHNREMRPSFSMPGVMKANIRHITLVGKEALSAVNTKLGLELGAGSIGENILTEGLGELSEVHDGATIRFQRGLVLTVVEQNEPCSNLRPLHRLMVKTIYGRRGLLCSIVDGVGTTVLPGDWIEVS